MLLCNMQLKSRERCYQRSIRARAFTALAARPALKARVVTQVLGRHGGFDKTFYPRHGWSLSGPGDDFLNRLGGPLQDCLDGSIVAVSYPPSDGKALGARTQRVAVTNSVDAAADTNLPCNHARRLSEC